MTVHRVHTSSATAPYDVVVLGGGASGLAAAISAAHAGARACVLERDVAAGLSILATGNGRCNISNAHLETARYRHPDVAASIMGASPEHTVARFFEQLGLLIIEEDEGRLYPITRRAESVRDVLLGACARLGIDLRCTAELVEAHPTNGNAWQLTLSEPASPLRVRPGKDAKTAIRQARRARETAARETRDIHARSMVVAVGGASEEVCRLLGLPHLPERAVLCPIGCTAALPSAPALAELDGLRCHAALSLMRHGSAVAFESGEILFRPYGISGIAAFNLSRRIKPHDRIELDLLPHLGAGKTLDLLNAREEMVGPFDGDPAWFDGLLARPLASYVCRAAGGNTATLARIATLLRRLPLLVEGTAETRQAQIRRGGIPLDAIDPSSLRLATRTDTSALFACGEALDMDADCGGYNLAWAWLTGMRAGTEAARAAQAPSY